VDRAGARHVEAVAEPAGEQRGARVGDDDAAAYVRSWERIQRDSAQGHLVVDDLRAHPEPVGQRGGLVGPVADDGRDRAGPDDQTGTRVGEHGAGWRRVLGLLRLDVVGCQREHATHAGRGDPAPDDLVGVLGGGAQRDHQERRVAVERDQLTGADPPLHGIPRPQPDHDDHEHPGQEHLQPVEDGLQPRDLDTGPPGGLRLAHVAVVEDLLAADAPQHPEPADDVRGGVGEVPHQVALVGTAAVQRPQQRRDEQHQHGHADQHQQPERHRGGEQDRGDQHERDHRAGEAGRDVHDLPDARQVVGADRDHLAGRHLARQRAAEVHGVAGDELDGAVRRGQPVGDREPVPHDAADRLEQPDREHDAGVHDQRLAVLGGDPAVDRATDHGGHHGLRAHPDDAAGHPEHESVPLAPGNPPQEPRRRPDVRRSGMVEGEAAHSPEPTERDGSPANH
jgi:hypothetical protein